MQKKIQSILQTSPGLKARNIAVRLGNDRQHVNTVLHGHPTVFSQDDDFLWYLTSQRVLEIRLPGNAWLTSSCFEGILCNVGSPLESTLPAVSFIFGDDCKIMMDALARVLAFSNQLETAKKFVTLDFSRCRSTLTYLDRAGFFEHLHPAIAVLPKRPTGSKAIYYSGNSHGLVELKKIYPTSPDKTIPELLKNSFVVCAGNSYSLAAFTVLAELLHNVEEHSGAATAGFAGLQFYKKANHIQTVISDSGLGIVGTLQPIISRRYPLVAEKIAASPLPPEVALLKEIFSEGRISQKKTDGSGLGLKRSSDLAKKYKAKITVRQERFELIVRHSPTGTSFDHSQNLVKLAGTHICFDFELDPNRIL